MLKREDTNSYQYPNQLLRSQLKRINRMKIFNLKERMRRTTYFFRKADLIFLLINLTLVFLILGESEDNSTLIVIYMILLALCLLSFIAFDIIITVQRLHDLNKKGTWYFAKFIPIYNIIFAFELLFVKGTKVSNAYGNDPRLMGKGKYVNNIFLNIGILLFLVFSVVTLNNLKEEKENRITSVIISNPRNNDYCIYEYEDTTGLKYSIFRINTVIKDSLIVSGSIYAFSSQLEAFDAIDEYQTSGNDFWGEQEIISNREFKKIKIVKAKRMKSK